MKNIALSVVLLIANAVLSVVWYHRGAIGWAMCASFFVGAMATSLIAQFAVRKDLS